VGEVSVRRAADMRYGEQVFEINVPLDDDAMTPEAIAAAFHARHRALYTYALEDQEAVLVNARLSVIGRLSPTGQEAAAPVTAAARIGERRIWLDGWTDVPVYDFARLAEGQTLAGPAIVGAETTTVLLRNGDTARFDARGWLDVTVGLSKSGS
jgi:N-methylhydantoinase A